LTPLDSTAQLRSNFSVWPRIAVFGAGAVGCYFGAVLARAGAPVTLICRPAHAAAISRDGLLFESVKFTERVTIQATDDPSAVRTATLVLFCVKTTDTESAARLLAQHLDPTAAVVSLQNGVDNVERIRAAAGIAALPSVVYVAASMPGPGHLKHVGRGDLIVGREAADVAACFERAGVPCPIRENIAAELWTKLIINCAYNAISALTGTRYAEIAGDSGARDVMRCAVDECLAVAAASGVNLSASPVWESALKLGRAMQYATSSTAQDLERGKRTEIDSLNGFITRRAAEFGLTAPVNQALHALVKLREEFQSPVNPASAG
jgi:2-dehydropantoate 2-reductase